MDRNQKIYKEVAKRYDLTIEQVEEIFKSQCKFTENVMRENKTSKEDRAIRWPNFGVFYVKNGLRDYFNKIEKQQDEKQQD